MTCHLRFHQVSPIIRKYSKFLYVKQQVRTVFIPVLFISFHSFYSLRNHFVRSIVQPLISEKGSFCCGKSRYEFCCNIKQIDNFGCLVTKKVYKINHSFSCDTKCLIYLFHLLIQAQQLIGSDSGKNCKSCQRNVADRETPNQNYFHFLNEGHNGVMHGFKNIFVDKTDPLDPTRREFF